MANGFIALCLGALVLSVASWVSVKSYNDYRYNKSAHDYYYDTQKELFQMRKSLGAVWGQVSKNALDIEGMK